MPIGRKNAKSFSVVAILSIAAFPLALLAAETADIEAATSIAADTKYKLELAAKCGTAISSQPNLRLERFAVALDLKTKGFGPQKLSQANFENVMTAVSTPESVAVISRRAMEASTANGCSQPDNIKYWSFLKEAGKIFGN